MNYADIKRVDVANGEGVRVSVFVSGCKHHCKGCFNQSAWDFNYGNKFTDEQIDTVLKYLDHDYISGLSLLGGEPLDPKNQEGLLPLVKKVKDKFPDKNIWCYTGFDFENTWEIDPNSTYKYPQLKGNRQQRVEGISIESLPNKLDYTQGEDINTDGGSIKITYEGGYDTTVLLTKDMLSGYDMSIVGTQTV